MPIPIEKIQVVEDEIERSHDQSNHHHDRNGIDHLHGQAMPPPQQDFSYLKHAAHGKRSVHYDIEPMNNDSEEEQPLRVPREPEPPLESVLRRRYIAHWGLPGLFRMTFSFVETVYLEIDVRQRSRSLTGVIDYA